MKTKQGLDDFIVTFIGADGSEIEQVVKKTGRAFTLKVAPGKDFQADRLATTKALDLARKKRAGVGAYRSSGRALYTFGTKD
jgi:hypothetical protein